MDPGPDTKLAITKSSIDKVKASSQPAPNAGRIIGNVMVKNTLIGRAPKSRAASSMDLSIWLKRLCTITVTYAIEKVMWAIKIVICPRSEERRVGKECRSRWSRDH